MGLNAIGRADFAQGIGKAQEKKLPATGCRATVWEAVQRGMTDDALALFQHYNSGLPEPQSPTELWQRLDGLMRWMPAKS